MPEIDNNQTIIMSKFLNIILNSRKLFVSLEEVRKRERKEKTRRFALSRCFIYKRAHELFKQKNAPVL
jgi:hypothetical protein